MEATRGDDTTEERSGRVPDLWPGLDSSGRDPHAQAGCRSRTGLIVTMGADEQGPASSGTGSRRTRVLRWADIKAVPLRTILISVGVVVLVYLTGQLLYRLRDVVLLVVVGSFVALVLNPAVVALQRWKIGRRGLAVAVVTFSALVIFVGLAFAFGYPLVNSLTHFANALPSYVNKAQHGKGWVGHLVRKYHVEAWVQKNSPKITSFAENLRETGLVAG